MPELWTEKFFPKSFDEFVGNKEIVKRVVQWANEWNDNNKQKPLFFWGQTGSGKTALAYLVAQQFEWELFELNASDYRAKDLIERLMGGAALNASFSGKKRLVLIDEVDGLQAVDRGGAAAINSIIKEAQTPIILTANNFYGDRKLEIFRATCEIIQFKKINYLSMAKRIKEILRKEKIEFDEKVIEELSKNANGDFRSLLLDIQTLSMSKKILKNSLTFLGYRERQENVFNVLRNTFKAKTFNEARLPQFSSEIDSDLFQKWIEENIPRHFSKPIDTAIAFERLSKADVFNGRIIKRQHWGFKRYSSDLMTAGIALSVKNEYHGFIKYEFPKVLTLLSKTRSIRALKEEIAEKLKTKIHSSKKEILSKDLFFIQLLFQENQEFAENFSALFKLNEEEIAFLLNSKPSTKKVKTIFENSKKILEKHLTKKNENKLEQNFKVQEFKEKTNDDSNQTRLF
jgi:replication factor C large subunit